MSRLFRLALLASALALVAGSGFAGATPDSTGANKAPEATTATSALTGKRVTVKLKDAQVVDVLMGLARDAGKSVAFRGDFPKPTVTVSFRDVDIARAVAMVCDAARLTCEAVPEGWLISTAPAVSVGGSSVPLLGAVSVSGGTSGAGSMASTFAEHLKAWDAALKQARGQMSLPGAPGAYGAKPPDFQGDDRLVDLDVKDVPLREAMAKLSEASGIEIVVHEAVPKEVKITARIYQMPLAEVLSLIVDQANLTYTVAFAPGPDAKKQHEAGLITERDSLERRDVATVHIVPRPELTVSLGGSSVPLVGAVSVSGGTSGAGSVAITLTERAKAVDAALRQARVQMSLSCPKCKQPCSDDWRFCPRCGAKLGQGAKQPAKGK